MKQPRNGIINRRSGRRSHRAAFTLFEVILAIALSTMLLALIGAAINLFLRQIESSRTDIEYAQLARAIFAMIGDDLRAASEYKPQDMSGVLAVAASAATNVNEVVDGQGDEEDTGTGSTGTETSGSVSTTGTLSSTTADGSAVPPGVQGTLLEVMIDASRPPRLDELFRRYSGYTSAQAVSADALGTPGAMTTGVLSPATDLRSVRYYVRQGDVVNPNSVDATSFSATAQLRGAGLVRQEMGRAERLFAEQIGDPSVSETGQVLVAPEVGKLEIRYFDGTTVLETWDMQLYGQLPVAVEIRIWLGDPTEMATTGIVLSGQSGLAANAREFRQTIFLPTARPAETTSETETSSGTAP